MKLGFTEILLILVVALFVLGPDKMPYYAKKLGEALKEFRKVSSEATKDIRESVIEPLEEAQKPLKEAMEPITELQKDIKGEVDGIKKSFTDLGKPTAKEEPKAEEPPAPQPEEAAPAEEPQASQTEEAAPAPEPAEEPAVPGEATASEEAEKAESVQ